MSKKSKTKIGVAQPFCQCTHRGGYLKDPKSGLQVCGCCGYPSKMYYMAWRSASPPGRPFKYANGSMGMNRCNKRPDLP